MTVPRPEERAVRTAEGVLRVAAGLAVAGLVLALYLRYRDPELVEHEWGTLQSATEPLGASTAELSVVTAATTVAESLDATRDSALPARPTPPAVPTDVVLLPCNEPNPRADGRFLIPPHDPTRRTIVGLPSAPGEPKRGLLIPPHDPAAETRIPIELVPLDSILERTIRIPPHDPTRFKLIRPDTLSCLE